MELTADQHAAIYTHDRNLIVVAGAGSGKTHVLVERYLALLDSNRGWPLNALVAITFTRKAAQEMRDRVRRELERRYSAAPDETCWANWLGSIESARIDTIHGLCASLLRANAAEAGVDPRFDVLEETDARLLLDSAIDQVLQSIVQNENPGVTLLLEYGTDKVREALVELIAAEPGDQPPDLLAHWQARWELGIMPALNQLAANTAFWAYADWQPPDGRWPDDSQDRILLSWQRSQDATNIIKERSNHTACLDALKTLKAINLSGSSAKRWGGQDIFNEAKRTLESLRDTAKAVLEMIGEPPGDYDRRAADLVPLWAALIRQTQDTYRAMKQADSLLDFNDLERLTRHLLNEHPAVCARYRGAEFRHLLVDEFQDTNAAQWDIVQRLADPTVPGCLFVVGDPKQSIYQFRGADVSVFDHVRSVIVNAGGEAVPLAQSFRTHQPLVVCFNHLFQHILAKTPGSPVSDYEVELGEPMSAFRTEPPQDCPPLELLLLDKARLPKDDDRAEPGRTWEAYEIAAYIRRAAGADGSPPRTVYDKQTREHRPLHYGDVAILFQSMRHVTLYEDALKAAGVPYVTVAGRGYYSRQEVWDVLNLLTALHNPADNLALAAALRSPLFNLSDDALLALRLSRDENGERRPLWDALDAAEGVPLAERPLAAFARDCLRELRGLAGRVTLADLLREILARTGYLATLTALPDGARRRGNVEKLIEKAQTGGQVMLGAFTQVLRDLTEREVREGEALIETQGVVTLMTVHAAKGLEFPLVVLADTTWKNNNADSGGVVRLDPMYGLTCKVYDSTTHKPESGCAHRQADRLRRLRDEAERKRLLYVAATRAQDYLLICGQIKPTQNGWTMGGWLDWLWAGLGLAAITPQTGMIEREGFSISLIVPLPPPDMPAVPENAGAPPAWDSAAVQAGAPLPGRTLAPALVAPVVVAADAPARHLTATQIADLGSAGYEPYYRDRFRRSVLHDAPAHIDTVSDYRGDVSRRLIGDMVHKVLGMKQPLGWWRWPTERANLDRILHSYAWQLGVVIPRQQDYAVSEARKMLDRFLTSDVYRWLQAAEAVFREIPFVLRTDGRILHGVLDVLARSNDSWTIIDYKTSYVRGYAGDPLAIRQHARRYHLQVGVYAAAAREQLGNLTPAVYIHYIRYGQTVRVDTNEWESALAKLDHYIGDLLVSQD